MAFVILGGAYNPWYFIGGVNRIIFFIVKTAKMFTINNIMAELLL